MKLSTMIKLHFLGLRQSPGQLSVHCPCERNGSSGREREDLQRRSARVAGGDGEEGQVSADVLRNIFTCVQNFKHCAATEL